MAKAKWADISSNLSHSHSGWLDLIMGLGIPGAFLIAGGLIFGLIAVSRNGAVINPWKSAAYWIALSIFILFFTTEVSQRIYLESLFLIIGFVIGLSLYSPLKNSGRSISETGKTEKFR
jgi:O-antigen ligase